MLALASVFPVELIRIVLDARQDTFNYAISLSNSDSQITIFLPHTIDQLCNLSNSDSQIILQLFNFVHLELGGKNLLETIDFSLILQAFMISLGISNIWLSPSCCCCFCWPYSLPVDSSLRTPRILLTLGSSKPTTPSRNRFTDSTRW